ncbi:MAG TPA: DUF202 domain-containing protein [Diaminobutyricibacter sp.]|jgi:uncharacterized membrane protein YidH (DUF202 family)|uniref:DUF202 domain-containing protein n=1 Tax=Leifsonia sp. McL0618 TaxID=3415677 RepID=UPI003383126B
MSSGELGDAPGRDPGLQGERTALSWTRTALVITVNALLALRTGLVSGELALTLVGVVLLLAAIGAVIYGTIRGRELSGHGGHHVPPAAPALALTILAAVTLIACAAGVASVLVRH